MTSDTQAPADVLRTVNETPALLSLLYDANLLPEQADTREKIVAMSAVVRAYQIGSNMAVKVKPLEWEREPPGLLTAYAPGYEYEVRAVYGGYRWHEQQTGSGAEGFGTEEEAIADVQANYDKCYMAGLVLAPVTPQQAAKVLLANTPNPIFDQLKYPMSGEFHIPVDTIDEDGNEHTHRETVPWSTIKEIIADALRAIAGGDT